MCIRDSLKNPKLRTVELAKTIKENMIEEMKKYQLKNPGLKEEII